MKSRNWRQQQRDWGWKERRSLEKWGKIRSGGNWYCQLGAVGLGFRSKKEDSGNLGADKIKRQLGQ